MPHTVHFSGNLIEITSYERVVSPRISKAVEVRYIRLSPKRKRSDNISRTKRHFVRCVCATTSVYGSPIFATFTFSVDVVSLSSAYSEYKNFILRLRRIQGFIEAVSVFERTKRGRLHIHTLLWGLSDDEADVYEKGRCVRYGRERTTRRIANIWGQGFVDLRATDGSLRLANYVAKYMQKAPVGLRAYYATSGIKRPQKVSFSEEQLQRFLSSGSMKVLKEFSFRSYWLGEVKKITYER